MLDVPEIGRLEVSMVDAANACVFVRAADFGLSGAELPAELDAAPAVLRRLEATRHAASVAMGIARDLQDAARITHVPFICIVSPPQPSVTTSRDTLAAADMELTARVISNGQPHQALPLTVTLCLAVASGIDGTIANQAAAARTGPALRVGMPSGILTADAEVVREAAGWHARSGSFFRTARPLFKGEVFVERDD